MIRIRYKNLINCGNRCSMIFNVYSVNTFFLWWALSVSLVNLSARFKHFIFTILFDIVTTLYSAMASKYYSYTAASYTDASHAMHTLHLKPVLKRRSNAINFRTPACRTLRMYRFVVLISSIEGDLFCRSLRRWEYIYIQYSYWVMASTYLFETEQQLA